MLDLILHWWGIWVLLLSYQWERIWKSLKIFSKDKENLEGKNPHVKTRGIMFKLFMSLLQKNVTIQVFKNTGITVIPVLVRTLASLHIIK